MTALDLLEEQTALLLATVGALDDLAGPSVLPGWSRGHVLGHISGNAEGLGRRARFVLDGVPRSMYESVESRNGDIEVRATRTREQHLLALAATHDDLMSDLAALPVDRYHDELELRMGLTMRVGQLPMMRLQEICIHHSDLAIDGYTWRDWPDELVAQFLPRVAGSFASRDDMPIGWIEADGERLVITEDVDAGLAGSGRELFAWLTGRAPGTGLQPVGLDSVPEAPRWL